MLSTFFLSFLLEASCSRGLSLVAWMECKVWGGCRAVIELVLSFATYVTKIVMQNFA